MYFCINSIFYCASMSYRLFFWTYIWSSLCSKTPVAWVFEAFCWVFSRKVLSFFLTLRFFWKIAWVFFSCPGFFVKLIEFFKWQKVYLVKVDFLAIKEIISVTYLSPVPWILKRKITEKLRYFEFLKEKLQKNSGTLSFWQKNGLEFFRSLSFFCLSFFRNVQKKAWGKG